VSLRPNLVYTRGNHLTSTPINALYSRHRVRAKVRIKREEVKQSPNDVPDDPRVCCRASLKERGHGCLTSAHEWKKRWGKGRSLLDEARRDIFIRRRGTIPDKYSTGRSE